MDASLGGNTGSEVGESRLEFPLVSIVTQTWRRHHLLPDIIENIQDQDWPNLEHIIVCDGQDPWVAAYIADVQKKKLRHPIRFFELGRNWTSVIKKSHAIAPSMVGALMAKGDFIGYVCDDDWVTTDYVTVMVGALERTGCDFAYPKGKIIRPGHADSIIGSQKMIFGTVVAFVHRAEAFAKGIWHFSDGQDNDWMLIRRWVTGGARPAFVDRVLYTKTADH